MDKKPIVSVVIPTWNRKSRLKDALDSVFAQTFIDYEVIVVDDASTDGTSEFISMAYPSIKLITLLRHKNAAGARNEAIKAAEGNFIAFLDSDDIWFTSFLEKSVRALRNNDRAVFSACDCLVTGRRPWTAYSTPSYPDAIHHQLMKNLVVTMSAVVIRKDALMKAGPLNETLPICHDRELYLRLLFLGDLVRVPEVLVKKLRHEDNLTNDYKRWTKDVFLLLDIFFSDERSRPYAKLLPAAKTHWALKMSYHAALHGDIPFAIRMFFHSFLSSPGRTPGQIVLFLTTACNLSCAHCFIHRPPAAMNLEHMKKIFNTLNSNAHVTLTGGEPFLRDDVPQLLDILLKNPYVRHISICTNGSMPEKVESTLKQILNKNIKKNLHLQVSLDGLKETHDSIRGRTGIFQLALETCERASRLKQNYPRFSFTVHTTIMGPNIHDIEKLVNYLTDRKIPGKLALYRHEAFSVFGVPPELLHLPTEINRSLEFDIAETSELIQRILKKHPTYFCSLQGRKIKIMLNTMRSQKRQTRCYAGYADAVIYANGDIAVCEHVKPFGNLADWGGNISKAWKSDEINGQRPRLRSCACTHGCNIMTSVSQGLTFNFLRMCL